MAASDILCIGYTGHRIQQQDLTQTSNPNLTILLEQEIYLASEGTRTVLLYIKNELWIRCGDRVQNT